MPEEDDGLVVNTVVITDLTWESIDIFNQNFIAIKEYVDNLTEQLTTANQTIENLETAVADLTLRVEALEPPEEEGEPE